MKFKNARWIIGIFIVIVLLIIGIGGKMHINNEKDIDIQRKSAISIKRVLSGVEELKFDENGGNVSGAGTWSCGVGVKIDGSWYGIVAVKNGVSGMKAGFLVENEKGGTSDKIKVIYSNGEVEYIV